MRIGYLQGGTRIEIQSALWAFAAGLISAGHRLAGMVERPAELKRESLLADVASSTALCIFQDLGPNAQSCTLDATALTLAAGLAEAAVTADTDLLILSKFGKLESEGGGFRQAIAKAQLLGVPVVTSVNPIFDEAWHHFTGGLADRLPIGEAELRNWWLACRASKTPADTNVE